MVWSDLTLRKVALYLKAGFRLIELLEDLGKARQPYGRFEVGSHYFGFEVLFDRARLFDWGHNHAVLLLRMVFFGIQKLALLMLWSLALGGGRALGVGL